MSQEFVHRLTALQEGTYRVHYLGRGYMLTKQTLLDGRLVKIYAYELGGNDVVSGNFYPTIRQGTLKPCEMSERKVIDFILGCVDD